MKSIRNKKYRTLQSIHSVCERNWRLINWKARNPFAFRHPWLSDHSYEETKNLYHVTYHMEIFQPSVQEDPDTEPPRFKIVLLVSLYAVTTCSIHGCSILDVLDYWWTPTPQKLFGADSNWRMTGSSGHRGKTLCPNIHSYILWAQLSNSFMLKCLM